MTLAWDQPETPVTGWTVRCYNSSGFDQSVTVTGCSATIEGVSTDSAYTVEVTAAGMSQNAWIAITANPISITDCAIQADDLNQISLAWIPGSHAPAGGWILLYTYGAGEENTEALQTVESAAVISTVLPNTTYTFSIQAADGTTVLNGVHTVTTPEAPAFSQYGLDASQVFMAAFPTPEDPDWATRDVEPDQQTTQFAPSSSIAFVLEATQGIGRSDEEVETLILVPGRPGNPCGLLHRLGPVAHHVDQRQISGAAGADAPNPRRLSAGGLLQPAAGPLYDLHHHPVTPVRQSQNFSKFASFPRFCAY